MADGITDDDLDVRLRASDPLRTWLPPSQDETEATLRQLLAHGPGSPGARRGLRARLTRPRLVAGAAAGAGAVIAAVVLMFGAVASSPAFAVTRNHNGTITVRVIRVSGIAGANHTLARMGVRVRLVTALEMARFMAASRLCRGFHARKAHVFTFDPSSIPRRQVLVMSLDPTGHFKLAARLSEQALTLARHARTSPARFHRARVVAVSVPAMVHSGKLTSIRMPRVVQLYCGAALTERVQSKSNRIPR